MKTYVETENCNSEIHYLINEFANSKVTIFIEHARIVSSQSKRNLKEVITNAIQNELKKFKWIIAGEVLVDFTWYLNAVEKQETDRIGDIDNISKPIQDSLIGPNGILIDDSQIAGLYSTWFTRNDLLTDNILRIDIRFNNDYTLYKHNLKFIQYECAMCMPYNLNKTNARDLFVAKIIISARKKSRQKARKFTAMGSNVDRYLVCSQWDFHRTRINAFESNNIITLSELNKLCLSNGLNFQQFICEYRLFKKKASCQHHV